MSRTQHNRMGSLFYNVGDSFSTYRLNASLNNAHKNLNRRVAGAAGTHRGRARASSANFEGMHRSITEISSARTDEANAEALARASCGDRDHASDVSFVWRHAGRAGGDRARRRDAVRQHRGRISLDDEAAVVRSQRRMQANGLA